MSKPSLSLALIIICNLFTSSFTYAQRHDFWNINFRKADSIATVHENRGLKNPEKLAEDLAMNLTTDVEKFRAIFRWITDNIHYDLNLFNEISEKQRRFRYDRNCLVRKSDLTTKYNASFIISNRQFATAMHLYWNV